MKSTLALLTVVACASCEWFTRPRPADSGWSSPQSSFAYARPALLGDTVYAATGDGRIIARHAGTGATLWSTGVATRQIEGANIVVESGIVAVPVVFETRAVDVHTGQNLWTYTPPLDTVDLGGAAAQPGMVSMVHIDAADSLVFVPAWGGTISALHARTGALVWRWTPPQLPHRFGAQGVTVRDGTLYANVWHFLDAFGTVCEGRVVALDARTGLERWQTVLPRQSTTVCLPGRPAVTATIVATQMVDGRAYGLNRETGALRWTVEQDTPAPGKSITSPITSLVADGETIFGDAGTGALRAISAADGSVLWRVPFGDSQFKRDITVTASRIYAPDGMYLYVFDRSSRRLLRTLTQPGDAVRGIFSSSVAAGETFVYATINGALWAFPN